MTRWLVTGAGGMLGQDLLVALGDEDVTGVTRAELDVTDPASVAAAVDGFDVVVNAAAWTNVDGAETAEEAATAVNGHAVATLAGACAASGARLLQVSTDYVLSGTGVEPHPENAPTAPVNAYGRGKLVGELAVRRLLPDAGYVVRTAWLYGAHGPNFVATMLRLAGERETLEVVADQFGQPTWSAALAGQLRDLGRAAVAGRAPGGIYHGTSAGRTSWYGLARATFEEAGLDPERVKPTTSDRFVRPAVRPANSTLSHLAWGNTPVAPLGPWREMLAKAFIEGLS
ncbi:NAD(P)-dependent oxidoreductase [Longispora fulva]|uniref:dTDP-4-dehydrorhamnose reductase n=1 Tax=Longispora fulva TaxID=619741 RepID=A0A8J7KLM1_9ACTN|nr:dTDP-4-dehydrorhamnose reductase [Longispora fulva]MBG6138141.1 dTDP-4-dehydrorhamnose reductase [Longispora fulva]GIG60394.1 NAD(P)-dependent oxidoreductase [Longispora fulva]